MILKERKETDGDLGPTDKNTEGKLVGWQPEASLTSWGSWPLPQQVAAIFRCDAMMPFFHKGCLQQPSTPSTGQHPRHLRYTPINSPFPHITKRKHCQVEPTQLLTFTHYYFLNETQEEKKRVKNSTLFSLFKVNVENRIIVNIY